MLGLGGAGSLLPPAVNLPPEPRTITVEIDTKAIALRIIDDMSREFIHGDPRSKVVPKGILSGRY